MKYPLFISLAVIFLGKGRLLEACSLESLKNLTDCIGLQPAMGLVGSVTQFSDLGRSLETMCNSGALIQMLNCTQEIFENCRNFTGIYASLSSLLDFDTMRSSYTYMCANVGELTAQADCINKHGQELGGCISQSSAELSKMFGDETKEPAELANLSQELTCKIQIVTSNCYKTKLSDCGNAAKVLMSMGSATRPSSCEKYADFTLPTDGDNSASTFVASKYILLVLYAALLLLFKS